MADPQKVEQEVSWLGARLKEPSTYAGLGILLALLLHIHDSSAVATDVQTIGIGTVLTGIAGLIAIVLKEKGAAKVLAWLILGPAIVFWLILSSAYAADAQVPLPAPAPATTAPATTAPVAYCTQTACTGLYGGLDLLESGGSFNVAATGLSGLAQSNFAMGGHLGAEYWNGNLFAAVEGGVDYGLAQKGAIPGGGNQGLYDTYGLVKLGWSLASVFGFASTGTSTPTLPSSLANALIAPYAIIGIWDRPWGAGLATGAGVQALVANNWTISIDDIYVNYNNANINAIASEQSENIVRATLDYHFKP